MKYNEQAVINDIKMLSLDMIDNANSGHPGICLGMATTMYTLLTYHLKFNSNNPNWYNRDRLILSAGHGSALLYASLFSVGYDYTIEDLKKFRTLGSKTPGHPEYNPNLGIEMTTGPLGQGIATSVGLGIAEKYLNSTFTDKAFDYKIYTICGDGDLMEGVSYEALSLAGTLNLNNLIIIYDCNNISLDGSTSLSFTDNIEERFSSIGFEVISVSDGENIKEINEAILKARVSSRPCLIKVNTVIGRYSNNENTNKVHGSPLEKEDLDSVRNRLTDIKEPFSYHEDNMNLYREYLNNKNNLIDDKENNDLYSISDVELKNIELSEDIDNYSLREINGKVMNLIAPLSKLFMGGSADVVSSTKTYLKDYGDFSKDNYNGRNIYFGVREHAMGCIMNGLALSGIRSFGSTFLTFSDYLKPAIRESALMNLPVTYIFTHDSINIGEDGPTHQPIEQINALRIIPNFSVYRPCNYNEIIGSWQSIFKNNKPCALILSRNKVMNINGADSSKVSLGGYVISPEEGELKLIIIATGSEVETAIKVKEELNNKNIRIVSMPNLNLFLEQSNEYKENIIPEDTEKLVIEYGNDSVWYRFTKHVIGINTFGESGNSSDVIKHFKLDTTSIIEYIKNNFKI